MSASGRRLLLNDATPAVPPLMDVLTSVTKRVIVLLCNKSILGGSVKVTNLPYLEGSCYVTELYIYGGVLLRNTTVYWRVHVT